MPDQPGHVREEDDGGGLPGPAGQGLEEVRQVRVQAPDGVDLLPALHHPLPGRPVLPLQVTEESRQEVQHLPRGGASPACQGTFTEQR